MERRKAPLVRQKEKQNRKVGYIGVAATLFVFVCGWCGSISRSDATQNARLDAYSSVEKSSTEELHEINDKVSDIQKNLAALTMQMKYKQDKNQ